MSDDVLAVTLDDSPSEQAEHIGQLGRLKLEKLLGSGGMGAVFEAFDPDLERRVAVKVLHERSADGRTRVLREARAMAKVSHPNVIAVFDVGTVNSTDFVVMELIAGETLDAWTKRVHPSWREIVAAFVKAGRGLAAAHAAALVHRDFKPSNALRARDGRIVVTDFGLSSSDGSDETGRGTPAYMAPEQWRGEPVSAATDQFSFSVALAELLAGAHPYAGDSIDQTRVNALAAAKLEGVPRAVRAIVKRGLAVDAAARWPSITAMLDALERRLHRRRRVALAGIGLIALGGLAILLGRHAPAVDDCLAPVIDPDSIATGMLPPEVASVVRGELATWRAQRLTACHGPIAIRSAQLSCLDGALARLELATRLATEHPIAGPAGVEGVGGILADAAMCTRDRPPRLATAITPELARALADYRLAIAGQSSAPDHAPTSPCAAAVALRARVVARTWTAIDIPDLVAIDRDGSAAAAFGRRCIEDELARAIGEGDLADADEQVPQADLVAALDIARARRLRVDQPSAAISLFEDAAIKFGARHRPRSQVHAILGALAVLLARGNEADLARVDELVKRWHATGTIDDTRALDDRGARARWRRGDVTGADAVLLDVGAVPSFEPPSRAIGPETTVTGRVFDAHGHPVAGAEVVAGATLDSDSAHGASPFSIESATRTHSDAHGAYVLPHVRGPVVAWTANFNSPMSDAANTHHDCLLADIHRVRGHVDLAGTAATSVMVELYSVENPWTGIAPVLADGSFELDRVMPGKYRVCAHPYGIEVGGVEQTIEVHGDVENVRLVARPARPFAVIGRSNGFGAPDLALVFMFWGTAPKAATVRTLDPDSAIHLIMTAWGYPSTRVGLTEAVRQRLEPNDVVSTFIDRPTTPSYVCAAGLSAQKLASFSGDAYWEFLRSLEVRCADVSATDPVIILDLPTPPH